MKILIVDDHKKIAAAYERAILSEELFGEAVIVKAHDCRQAYEAVQAANNEGTGFDLAIIDYKLPPYYELSLFNGADLVNYIKKVLIYCKNILVTAYQPPETIRSVITDIMPEGMAFKADLTLEKLIIVIAAVMEGQRYYTASVKKMISFL